MDNDTKINEMEITDEYAMADSKETVEVVAQKLRHLHDESDQGAVLVTVDKNRVIGFITKKEIIDLVAMGTDFSKKAAQEIMNTDFMEVLEDETLGNLIPKISEEYPNAIVVVNSEQDCVGFFSKNDYKDALAGLGCYDKKHEPKTEGDWQTRGIAMSSLGEKSEAIKCFEKSVESNPDKEKGWSDLAKKLENLHKLKEAIMCYDKVLTINSDNEEALTEKGDIYAQEKTDHLAIQSYKKALEVNPNNVDALMKLGMEQANIGEIDEAMKYLDKAFSLKGQTPELWFRKGNVFDIAKKYEDSLDCYNNATELNDYYEEAWFNKGIVYNRMGQEDDALQCLIKILRINPQNETAREYINTYKLNGTLQMY